MAKREARTVRTTISIPAELKRRMGEVAEPVNWSALAAEAFQEKLAAIAARRKEKAMSSVLERLRASKRRGETTDYQDGYRLGKKWAEESAEASELQRLEDLRDELESQPQHDWDDYFDLSEPRVYGPDEGLYFALHPEVGKDRRAAEDFWQSIAGDSVRESANAGAFLMGFTEGALDVWSSVKDEL